MSLHLDGMASPVTALAFVGNYLCTGEGPFLHIYDCDKRKHIEVSQIFSGPNIHGIALGSKSSNSTDTNWEEDGCQLFVYGGKSCHVVECKFNDGAKILPSKIARDFSDWILAVCCLKNSEEKNSSLALALAHNVVVHWDWCKDVILTQVQAEDKCILYSAHFIGNSWENLILAAGTVFNQIRIWAMNGELDKDKNIKTLHELDGHEGVIFSIAFDPKSKRLCSVSDDRSIRMWQLKGPLMGAAMEETDITIAMWQNMEYQPLPVLYGHTARVWDVKLCEDYFVSIGEDATCCVWNYEGQILQKFKGHKGKSIWSLAVNEKEKMLATGGGDCGIKLRILEDTLQKSKQCHATTLSVPDVEDFPRTLKLLNDNILLVMTNEGCLGKYEINEKSWSVLLQDEKFKSYSILSTAPSGDVIIIGSIHGYIRIIYNDLEIEEKIFDGKVLSVVWLKQASNGAHQFITAGPEGEMIHWMLSFNAQQINIEKKQTFTLPPGKQRWITAATILEDEELFLCGDRGGSIHLYYSDSQVDHVIQTMWKIHGKAGVTDICYYDNHIYSCGRDGLYRQYSIEDGALEVLNSNKISKGLEWIAGLQFLHDDLVILAFHTNNFLVHSTNNNQTLLTIPCGGGHRAWDFKFTPGCGRFVYIKSKDIVLCEAPISLDSTDLKKSLHGREITQLQHVFTRTNETGISHICATSSEDTTINLIEILYDTTNHMTGCDIKLLCTLQGHISSVRTLAISSSCVKKPRCDSQLLFSAGGRAQMKAWKIHYDKKENQESENKVEAKCWYEYLSTHLLCPKGKKRRKPWKSVQYDASPETRYMDLAACSFTEAGMPDHVGIHFVGAACSDGFVRLFLFNEDSKAFTLFWESPFHDHCVLCIKHLVICTPSGRKTYLFSCGTDGRIALWDISCVIQASHKVLTETLDAKENTAKQSLPQDGSTRFMSECMSSSDDIAMTHNQLTQPLCYSQAHQSGINALDVIESNGKILCVSGGDDNAVHVFSIPIKDGIPQRIEKIASELSAHATQVTGVSILSEEKFLTCSIDQRIIVWKILRENDSSLGKLQMIDCKYTNVADISSLCVWKGAEKEELNAGVSGVGIQFFRIS